MEPIRAIQPTSPAMSVLLALALIHFVCPTCAPGTEWSDPSEKEVRAVNQEKPAVAEDNNRFALDLYARLRTGHADNLFFSPASLSTALAMTYAGARGETASQMAKVLHFTLPQEKLHPAFGDLRRSWDVGGKERGYRLVVANRLWGQTGFHFLPGFLAVTREHYGAELAQVDFARAPTRPASGSTPGSRNRRRERSRISSQRASWTP